jgi:hypothetical protein
VLQVELATMMTIDGWDASAHVYGAGLAASAGNVIAFADHYLFLEVDGTARLEPRRLSLYELHRPQLSPERGVELFAFNGLVAEFAFGYDKIPADYADAVLYESPLLERGFSTTDAYAYAGDRVLFLASEKGGNTLYVFDAASAELLASRDLQGGGGGGLEILIPAADGEHAYIYVFNGDSTRIHTLSIMPGAFVPPS